MLPTACLCTSVNLQRGHDSSAAHEEAWGNFVIGCITTHGLPSRQLLQTLLLDQQRLNFLANIFRHRKTSTPRMSLSSATFCSQLVEADKQRQANREALTALRRQQRSGETSSTSSSGSSGPTAAAAGGPQGQQQHKVYLLPSAVASSAPIAFVKLPIADAMQRIETGGFIGRLYFV